MQIQKMKANKGEMKKNVKMNKILDENEIIISLICVICQNWNRNVN